MYADVRGKPNVYKVGVMTGDSDLLRHIQAIQLGIESSECVEDLLKTLIHSALPQPLAVAAFMCEVANDARLKIIGTYGYPEDWYSGDGGSARLWEASAIGDALRSGVIKVFRNKVEYLEAYPHNRNTELPGDGFAAIPIWRGGHPVFGLGIALATDPVSVLGHKNIVVWEAVRIALELSLSVPSWNAAALVGTQTTTLKIVRDQPKEQSLTGRQADILRLMSYGYTNRQIAGRLHISGSTVGKETLEIYKKLGTNNRKTATELALESGLISREEEFATPAPLGLAAAAE